MGQHSAYQISDPHMNETIKGVHMGKIVGIDEAGVVYVDFELNTTGPLPAKVSGAMQSRIEHRGWTASAQVLLIFEDADPSKPVILDTVGDTVQSAASKNEVAIQVDEENDITVDGRTITFDAREQIVLKCGKSSITLTRAGKVIIRGAYLLNRSSGVNKIKGGSVQIN